MENKPEALLAQMRNLIYGNWQTCITYAFSELALADILEKGPMTIENLSNESGIDKKNMYRLLRCCAQMRLIHIEPDTNLVSLTEFGELLRSSHPFSQRNAARLNGVFYRYEPWGKIVEILRSGSSSENFSDTYRQGSLDFLQDKPELLSVFQKAMTDLSVTENETLAKSYNFSTFKQIIDIGGGHGTFIKSVLENNPNLSGTIFDLKETFDTFESQEKTFSNRLKMFEGNFFIPESIPGYGDVYTMKNILHNWPEEKVILIMRNVHQAITSVPGFSKKRILVIEHLMNDDNNTESIVPWMDMNFFILVGGQDRTLSEYENIFKDSGFIIHNVIPTNTGRSIIELEAIV